MAALCRAIEPPPNDIRQISRCSIGAKHSGRREFYPVRDWIDRLSFRARVSISIAILFAVLLMVLD